MNSGIFANALARGLAAAALIAAAVPAFAGELNDSPLRGGFGDESIKGYGRWDGYYFGATLGAGAATGAFGNGSNTQQNIAVAASGLPNQSELASWSALPDAMRSFRNWGGFGGINRQLDRLVLSAEVSYSRPFGATTVTSSNTTAHNFTSGSYAYNVNVTAMSSLTLDQYGTVRGRVGYVVGQFLPYVALGVAVGSVSYSDRGTVSYTAVDISGTGQPSLSGSFTSNAGRNNVVAYGGVGAVGVDVTILPNMFLRGEYEYVAFAPIGGHRLMLSTFRGGIGLKF